MSNGDPLERAARDDADQTRPPAEEDTALRTVGPYRLLQKIGEGGMGEVWLAEQTQPVRRQVALKLIKAGMDTAHVVARFEAERQALAVMDHPNIAKVFDGGSTAEGRPYFVMEYVRGEPITEYCDRVKMPLRERLELFATLCAGVQHAHQKGIIHRDLKPSNVLVSENADRPVPRIIDFGIAKATAQPLTVTAMHTEIGSFIGTPEYISPEQADMTQDVDTRSDVYSLGMILYELITGTLPFDSQTLRGAGPEEMRRIIRESEPARPSTRIGHLPDKGQSAAAARGMLAAKFVSHLHGELDWITLKAIEKDRSRRYETASSFANDVRRHLQHEAVEAAKPSAVYTVRKFVRRHRFGVGAVSVAIVLIAIFVTALAIQARRIASERDRANQEAATATRVTEFLINSFNVSDPSEARGNSLTAREVLSKGASQLEGSLQGEPRLRTRLETTIATVYTNLGLYTEAGAILERAVKTSRESLGDSDLDVVAAVNALATLSWYRNEFGRAGDLYERVLEARRHHLGADHADTLKAQFDLASAYMGAKRWAEGETLLNETLRRQRAILGDAHADTLSSLNNLQYLYFEQKKYAEALPIASEVLKHRTTLLGHDHPRTIGAMHNLATVHEALGDLENAERLEAAAVSDYRRVLGDSHPSTLKTWEIYVRILDERGLHAKASDELRALVAGIGDQPGRAYSEIRERSVKRLISLSEEAGDRAAAAHWRQALAPVNR